jgi:hypothetical protein
MSKSFVTSVHAQVESDADGRFDLISLYPGRIQGGCEQLVIDLLPRIVALDGVRAWTFDRGFEPAPMIALLLDLDVGVLDDIMDTCEETLSSSLREEPGLTLWPLVEVPNTMPAGGHAPWGVYHSRIPLAVGSAERADAYLALEQAIGETAMRLLTHVREASWDRKSLAPRLLSRLLELSGVGEQAGVLAFDCMRILLTDHPRSEALTRQFRSNAHRLSRGGVNILEQGPGNFEAAMHELLASLASTLRVYSGTPAASAVASVWRRLSGAIGFNPVEAAYIACLTACALGEG